MSLANHFAAYTAWRTRLADCLGTFQTWLNKNELSDGQSDLRLSQLLERLREDRLNVAFVAEFSRGKSELINAVFFVVLIVVLLRLMEASKELKPKVDRISDRLDSISAKVDDIATNVQSTVKDVGEKTATERSTSSG